jgi:hypothetical protein
MKQGFWNPFNGISSPEIKMDDETALEEIEREMKEIEF